MRTVLFLANESTYLAIQRRRDPPHRIPVYKKESDGKYHFVDCMTFPACTKFLHYIEFKLDEDLTPDQIEQQFREISALPW